MSASRATGAARSGTGLLAAAAQIRCAVGETEANRQRGLDWLERAADQGAGLAVLPELSVPGYAPPTREEAMRLAEPVPGPSTEAWAGLARRTGMTIVGGLAERDGDGCYNAAVAVTPDGATAVYRKAHLFERERDVFDAGDTGFEAVAAPFGTLGMLICYDLRFPEAMRTLALKSVEVVAVPTAWVTLAGRRTDDAGVSIQAYCALASASMNRVFLVCAGMVGPFRDTAFLGNSLITDVTGWPLAGPADGESELLLVATIDPSAARSKAITPRNDLLAERRTDLYETERRKAGEGPVAVHGRRAGG
ncbi:MAG: nitrilase-related carbon-nitrogen hydrolase [Actinomycetota bacterium]